LRNADAIGIGLDADAKLWVIFNVFFMGKAAVKVLISNVVEVTLL
jgi:hypothetical protein